MEKVARSEPPSHLSDIAHASLGELEAGKAGNDATEKVESMPEKRKAHG
ncbi:MAG: hypothetical protein VYA34_03465 [Myxococcota bacterium]|nr:hypothetical protein [Myxococcota bacterium]